MTNQTPTPNKSPVETFTPESRLEDSFTLKQKISSAENGTVWLAYDEEMAQEVTLHFLPDALLFDPRALDELRQEVRNNRQLIHPGVVRVYDLIEGPGWVAISADYCDTETLAALQAKKNGGVFEPSEIGAWMSSICQTIDDAHRANLLHGDLTPENILLAQSGKISIANFGISRIVREALNRAQPERAEHDLPRISPQQLDGERLARWDDIYSIGILFHLLLTGKPPFGGGDVLQQIRRNPPASVSERRAALGIKGGEVPKNWESVIAACLEKHTDTRPKTAFEINERLSSTAEIVAPVAAETPKKKEVLDEHLLWGGKKPSAEKTPSSQKTAENRTAEKSLLPQKPAEKKPDWKKSFFETFVEKKAEQNKTPSESKSAKSTALPPGSLARFLERVPESVSKKTGGKFPVRIVAVVLAVVALIVFSLIQKKSAPQKALAKNSPVPAKSVAPTPAKVAKASASKAPQPSATPVAVVSVPSEKDLPPGAPPALEQARRDFEEAEKIRQEKTKVQQQAEADFQQTQKTIDEKLGAAELLKKSADDAAAARKQREEDERKAVAEAEAASKAAAEKARLADEAKKASEQVLNQIKNQQAAQQKADAEVQELQRSVAEKQLVAGSAAKSVADAETRLKEKQAAFKKAQEETAKASALAAQATAEKAAASALKSPAPQGSVLENLTPIAPGKSPLPNPLDTPQHLVLNQAAPQTTPLPTPAPSAAPAVANPRSEIDRKLENSLGMKFVPVDNALFSIWLTRVQDFEAFANATGFKGTSWKQPGYKQGPDHPVVNVTWNDAMAFCKWLTEKERKAGLLAADQAYRLPTDIEWSKAVGLSGESGRTPEVRDMDVPDIYPWGTQWPPPQGAGNYTGEETGSDVSIKGYDDGYAWTSPVGSFTPNKYGLFDMGGNAWEWCMDWWNAAEKAKVLRGASWYNGGLKLSLLSSCRLQSAPDFTTDNFGFRVVIATELAKGKK